MEKINQTNELLKKYFSIDIYDINSLQKTNLGKELYDELKKYFEFSINLQEAIYKNNNEKISLYLDEISIERVPNSLRETLLKNEEPIELELSLDNLGYDVINVYYFLEKDGDKMFIGNYVGMSKIKKYSKPITTSKYLTIIDDILNVELNINTCSYIRTKDEQLICKHLDTCNFNGYNQNDFFPENIILDCNLFTKEIKGPLNHIPQYFIDYLFKKWIRYNEENILFAIFTCVRNHLLKTLKENTQNFYRYFLDFSEEYSYINSFCIKENIKLPLLDAISLNDFTNKLNTSDLKTDEQKIIKQKIEEFEFKKQVTLDSIKNDVEEINTCYKLARCKVSFVLERQSHETYQFYDFEEIISNLYFEFSNILNSKYNTLDNLTHWIDNGQTAINETIQNIEKGDIFLDFDGNIIRENDLGYIDCDKLIKLINSTIPYLTTFLNIKKEFSDKQYLEKYQSLCSQEENLRSEYNACVYHLEKLICIFEHIVKLKSDNCNHKYIYSFILQSLNKDDICFTETCNLFDEFDNLTSYITSYSPVEEPIFNKVLEKRLNMINQNME